MIFTRNFLASFVFKYNLSLPDPAMYLIIEPNVLRLFALPLNRTQIANITSETFVKYIFIECISTR